MSVACWSVFGVPTAKTSPNACARLSPAVTVAVLCVLGSMASFSHTRLLAAGGSEAIHRMAETLLNFTHVPSVSQMETLQSILDDHTTTVAERVVAEALMNVEHIAGPDDKRRLDALIGDESAPAAVKTLATIINNLTHTPTEVDKEKLRQLLQQTCRR